MDILDSIIKVSTKFGIIMFILGFGIVLRDFGFWWSAVSMTFVCLGLFGIIHESAENDKEYIDGRLENLKSYLKDYTDIQIEAKKNYDNMKSLIEKRDTLKKKIDNNL